MIHSQVDGDWEGWDGETIVKLMDGSVWQQTEYHYEYSYSYMPAARVQDGLMFVDGMSRGIAVEQISPRESRVAGEWSGWDGETIVELEDSTTWQQAEYLYEYHYAYRPEAMVHDNQMVVEGMSRPVRVRRIR